MPTHTVPYALYSASTSLTQPYLETYLQGLGLNALLTRVALPLQPEVETRYTLATEPFQPILEVLANLERDDLSPLFKRLDLSNYIDAYGSHASLSTSIARSYSKTIIA
jgi:hypothetical protein